MRRIGVLIICLATAGCSTVRYETTALDGTKTVVEIRSFGLRREIESLDLKAGMMRGYSSREADMVRAAAEGAASGARNQLP